METPRSSDTIDLSKAFIHIVRLLIENIRTVTITLVVCLGIGCFYYWVAPKTFDSKMIIQSDILSESYSLKLAENLNNHIRDRDVSFLASKLNLTNEEAHQLIEFKIVSALTPMSQQMAEKDKIIVVISVRIRDNAILPKLQSGIILYFSNNDYIKKRVDENRKKYEGLIYALDREIKRLDTLKNKLSNGTLTNTKFGGVYFMDVADLYGVAADLYEKKYNFMIDLATVDSIEVIEDFTPYDKPVWPKLSIVLAASLALAVFVTFILLSTTSFRGQPIK